MFVLSLLLSAAVAAAPAPLRDPTGIAFDRQGNLWICNYASGTVLEYGAASIAGSGSPPPVRTIRGLRGPNNIVFDRQGTLWLAEYQGGSLAAIRAGRVVARVRFPKLAYAAPTGLSFDRAGSLWVTDQRSDQLWGFSPNQLRHSGEKMPAQSVQLPGGVVANNQSVAFDAAGRVRAALLRAPRPGQHLCRHLVHESAQHRFRPRGTALDDPVLGRDPRLCG